MSTRRLKQRNIYIFLTVYIIFLSSQVNAQDFLSSQYSSHLRISSILEEKVLKGQNYLTYTTLTNEINNASEDLFWDQNFIDGFGSEEKNVHIEPIIIFTSFNSEYPHGFNDGGLWQGAGINTLIQTGASFDYKGLSVNVHPEFLLSENNSYDVMPADNSFSSKYAYFVRNIDLPQRFGDDVYQKFSWGESEIRYKFKCLQIGFGWQNAWVGPATQNPILLGNSADGFPKIDFGFRKDIKYVGLLDVRALWGKTSESGYFNDISTDDHNLFSGFFLSYVPHFIPGFTLGVNRIKLSPWVNLSFSDVITIFDPESDSKYGRDTADQRASVTCEWKFPNAGFRSYFEWARNDYSPTLRDNILLEPSHSQAYTLGLEQVVFIKKNHLLSVNAEITQLIHSRDYEIGLGMSQTGFYTHGIIKQGHTNDGQILGAGIGPGAESQYLGIDYFFERGSVTLFFRRLSRNKDYIYGDHDREKGDILRLNVEITGGIHGLYFINNALHMTAEVNVSDNLNWNYEEGNDKINVYCSIGLNVFI